MRIIAPSHEILTPIDGVQIFKHIEECGQIAELHHVDTVGMRRRENNRYFGRLK